MTDPMELVGRIDGILTDNGTDYHPILRCTLTEAAACIRGMVERIDMLEGEIENIYFDLMED